MLKVKLTDYETGEQRVFDATIVHLDSEERAGEPIGCHVLLYIPAQDVGAVEHIMERLRQFEEMDQRHNDKAISAEGGAK